MTGRSITSQSLTNFDGDKIKRVMTIYADPNALAFLTGVTDTPTKAVKPPAFEPHPDPKSVWEVAFAAWGAGKFAQLETKQTAFDKYVHPEIVIDILGDVGLPKVFKVFHGHAGCDTWASELMGRWEFTRMETGVDVGSSPATCCKSSNAMRGSRATRATRRRESSCSSRRHTAPSYDSVRHTAPSYDSEGKSVHNKIFCANPQMVASLYMTGSAMAVPRPEPAAAEPTDMSEAPTEVASAEAASEATPVAEERVAEAAAEATPEAEAEVRGAPTEVMEAEAVAEATPVAEEVVAEAAAEAAEAPSIFF